MQEFTLARNDSTLDEFWFVEHNPIFTQGQAGKAEHSTLGGYEREVGGATGFGECNFKSLFESIEREQAKRGNL